MIIAVNAILYYEKPRGVGRYINCLLNELSEIDSEDTYIVFYASWMASYEFLNIKKKNFNFVCLKNIPKGRILRNLYLAFIFPFICLKHHPNILHIPDTSPLFIKTCKTIVTIHDLAEFHISGKYSLVQTILRKYIVINECKKADKIITVSNYSKNDIVARMKAKNIEVIYNGADKKNIKQTRNNNRLFKKEYFLYVGEIEKTKNVPFLLDAYSELDIEIKNKYDLVIVGKKGNDYFEVNNKVIKYQLEKNVHVLDYVDDAELASLYTYAECTLFPSLFEGFGLPLIESMAFGVPVLCANMSCLPEIGGSAVLLFDPYDIDDLKSKIKKIVCNQNLRDRQILLGHQQAEKFSWKSCALKTLDIYQQVGNADEK